MDWPALILDATGAGDPWARFYESLVPGAKAFADAVDAPGRCLLKGRRAGGTVGLLYDLTHDLPPGKVALYITKTFKTAREIMWPVALKTNSEYGLGLTLRQGPMEIDVPNGGILRLAGCQDMGEAEKQRGKDIWRAAIDETASFDEELLRYLVQDVLDPTLAESGGNISLCGTPGTEAMGYFFDRTDGTQPWPTFRFTCLDNPHINGARAIERAMKLHGYGPTHPTLLREWFGQWVRDLESLIYAFNPSKNSCLTPFGLEATFTTIGCDVGYAPDQCGFTVCRSMPGVTDEVQILRSFRRGGMNLPQIAGVLEQLQHDYSPQKPCGIYIDTAGGSKIIAETLRSAHGLPCVSAYKPGKRHRIELIRGGLRTGSVTVVARDCKDLLDEWSVLVFDEDRNDHSSRCQDDASDSALYAVHRHKQYYRQEREEDKVGTQAWHRTQEDKDQREAEEEASRWLVMPAR